MITRLRWALEPIIGLAYLILWVLAESGRQNLGLAVMVLLAASIASARVSWVTTISLQIVALLGSALGVLHPLESTDWPAYQAIGIASGLAWASNGWRTRFALGGAALVETAAAAALMLREGWASWTGSLGVPVGVHVASLVGGGVVWLATCVAVGQVISSVEKRVHTEHALLSERLATTEADLVLIEERERVAREVHDVVAHSLAVILAQAEGARALERKRPAAMAGALESIALAARAALLDVRGIVDGLTGGGEPPQPTLEDLPTLTRGVEESGVQLRMTSAGEAAELGPAQQTAVYRILQEAATNAIRHRGRGSTLEVVLDWRGPGLSIQIVSTGTGSTEPTPGAGRGIPGMRERARLAGGWLSAGHDEAGDHRITSFVPYRVESDVAAA